MSDSLFQIAFIGPGGPEFLLVMLVLLMMFGAKDAPRILRKLNEIISQIRNTADDFKREVMYSDISSESPSYDDEDFDEDEDCDDGYHDEPLPEWDDDLDESKSDEDVHDEAKPEPEHALDEEDDAGKT